MTTKPPLPPPQQPPLLLTIRFSAAIPDLDLDIPHPGRTTVVSLKNLIRTRLAEPNSQRRLRFLYSGKILPDNSVLTSVLHLPLPPPPINTNVGGSSGKGKSVPGRPAPPQRIYINCSIGDSLTTAELDAEAEAAAKPLPANTSTTAHNNTGPSPEPNQTSPGGANGGGGGGNGTSTNTTNNDSGNTPRGFDRLLNAGFTPSEVNQLRLQFRSIHSSRYTPDTLPSPDSFRRMEDSWIDDNSSAAAGGPGAPANTAGGGGGGGGGMLGGGGDTDEVGIAATVDVLIRGVVVGFLWPMGSAGWLLREEGMASGRWRWMVGVGVVFAFLIGVIRGISGDY